MHTNELLRKMIINFVDRQGMTLADFCRCADIKPGTLTNMFMGRSNVSSKLFNFMLDSKKFPPGQMLTLRREIQTRRMAKYKPIENRD